MVSVGRYVVSKAVSAVAKSLVSVLRGAELGRLSLKDVRSVIMLAGVGAVVIMVS